MSGGTFNYRDQYLADELLKGRFVIRPKSLEDNAKWGRVFDPMHDKLISELVADVFTLIHKLDWYEAGDDGSDDYEKWVKTFKEKWFKSLDEAFVKDFIEKELERTKEELYKALNV